MRCSIACRTCGSIPRHRRPPSPGWRSGRRRRSPRSSVELRPGAHAADPADPRRTKRDGACKRVAPPDGARGPGDAMAGTVVDVGGGTGALLIALLAAHPTLQGIVIDLPAAVDVARTALAAPGVAGRAEGVAGSFFDPLPPGAGGYVLSAIVHNWNDDAAQAILRRCADAAGERAPSSVEFPGR